MTPERLGAPYLRALWAGTAGSARPVGAAGGYAPANAPSPPHFVSPPYFLGGTGLFVWNWGFMALSLPHEIAPYRDI